MTYVVTAKGERLSLLDPSPSVIDYDDVAGRLHRILRYGALPMTSWSVAQHSLLVGHLVSDHQEAVLYALLHDAHEAFLGDWITPVKLALAFAGDGSVPDGFRAAKGLHAMERRMATAIHVKAGLMFPPPPGIAELVIEADRCAYMTEVKHLIPKHIAKEFDTLDGPPATDSHVLSAIMHLGDAGLALKHAIDRAIERKPAFPREVVFG